ncbi:hypothetical protein [Geobacillus sp. YHL]|nr:hypothetical protein [Geobacillus sp. YHL]MCG6795816.1 hypothetical protein [Geobacillus sp. YHL]
MIQFHDFGIDIQTYTDRGKGNDFPDVNQSPTVHPAAPCIVTDTTNAMR